MWPSALRSRWTESRHVDYVTFWHTCFSTLIYECTLSSSYLFLKIVTFSDKYGIISKFNVVLENVLVLLMLSTLCCSQSSEV